MRKQFGAILLVTGLALTTACSGTAAAHSSSDRSPAAQRSVSATGAQPVTLKVGNSMSFEPSSIVVRAGQPVELTLSDDGVLPHDFTLSEGVPEPVKIGVAGGQTAQATFTLDRPGTYAFICSVPGHAMAGMRGTITAR